MRVVRPFTVAALVVGPALAVLESVASPNAHPVVLAFDVAAGCSFLIGAAVTSGGVGATRIPILFFVTGITWFVGPAIGPLQDLYVVPLATLLVVYPTGHIPREWRTIVLAGGVGMVAVAAALRSLAGVSLLLAAAASVAFMSGQRASSPLRRGRRSAAASAAVLASTMTLAGEGAAQGWISSDVARAVTSTAIGATALWLAADLRWGGWVGDALTHLVIDLGNAEPASVRDRLRRALSDDRLVIGYSVAGRPGFVDERGLAIELPDANVRQPVVPLLVGHEQVGVLIRSTEGDLDPGLVEGVAAAAALAIGNVRLNAELGQQVADLSASRRRLVAAVEEQRQRLQADVADRIIPTLGIVAQCISDAGGVESERLRREVTSIGGQLRDLAAGVGPTDVAIRGLSSALRSLAAQSPIPVSVSMDTPVLKGDPAATVFFVVSEGLANASKHAHASRAWVEVHQVVDDLVVEVRDDGIGGAVVVPGSGLEGLADRVGARGGSLEIQSADEGGVRLIARLPVGRSQHPTPVSDPARTA